MDSQSYLNEISSTAHPAEKPKKNILSNKFVLVGIILVVGIALMSIIGTILSNGKSGVKEQAFEIKFRLESVSNVISDYQRYVKSSDLRSSSASLSGVLSNTNRDLSAYIDGTYSNGPEKDIQASENERTEALKNELFNAKINGNLDRIYAHKMDYEISVLIQMENKLIKSSSNETLTSILQTSTDSLTNIQSKFSDYSEGY